MINSRTKIRTSRHSQPTSAFTLLEAVVLMAVIVVAVVLLWLVRLHPKSSRIGCLSNLKQIELAFLLWTGDNNNRYPTQFYTNQLGGPLFTNTTNTFRYFQVMSNELSNPKILVCPEDKQRKAATNFTSDFDGSHISYFAGLDASKAHPQSFLVGDSNLTNGTKLNNGLMELTTNQSVSWTAARHDGAGNIALADGSVQGFSTSALRNALKVTGLATNRLLMPPVQ